MANVNNNSKESSSAMLPSADKAEIELLRFQLTSKYSDLLRRENIVNGAFIENKWILADLKDEITQLAQRYQKLPTLISEARRRSCNKSQTLKLQRLQYRMEALVLYWSELGRKVRKHQTTCDIYTEERNRVYSQRSAMWESGLQMNNPTELKLTMVYFEQQEVLKPPVAKGQYLKNLWDNFSFEDRAQEIEQGLRQFMTLNL